MSDEYYFSVAHVGKEGTGDFGRRFGRIDERTTVNVQANSLEEATKKMKESSLVAQNKEQAIRSQNQDGTPTPRLVVKSIVKNPNTPNEKIIKETAFQKNMRARENKEFIQRTVNYLKRENKSPEQLFRDGLITYQDKLKVQKEMASPGVEGQNIKQVGGAKFTTPLGRFTGMKIPPKKFMDEGGIVKGKNGGMVRQCKPKVRIF